MKRKGAGRWPAPLHLHVSDRAADDQRGGAGGDDPGAVGALRIGCGGDGDPPRVVLKTPVAAL